MYIFFFFLTHREYPVIGVSSFADIEIVLRASVLPRLGLSSWPSQQQRILRPANEKKKANSTQTKQRTAMATALWTCRKFGNTKSAALRTCYVCQYSSRLVPFESGGNSFCLVLCLSLYNTGSWFLEWTIVRTQTFILCPSPWF